MLKGLKRYTNIIFIGWNIADYAPFFSNVKKGKWIAAAATKKMMISGRCN